MELCPLGTLIANANYLWEDSIFLGRVAFCGFNSYNRIVIFCDFQLAALLENTTIPHPLPVRHAQWTLIRTRLAAIPVKTVQDLQKLKKKVPGVKQNVFLCEIDYLKLF